MGDNGKKGGAHAGRPQGRKMASITKSGPTRIGLTRYTANDQPLPEAPKPVRRWRRRSGHGKHAAGAVRPAGTGATLTAPATGTAVATTGRPGGPAGPGRTAGGAGHAPGAAGPGGAAGAKVRKSRKERRAERAAQVAAAEAAMTPEALARDKDRRLRHRRHVILVSGLVGLFVLLTGGISAGVWLANRPPTYYSPAHVSADDAGIVVGGSGRVKVDVYVDFACPTCRELESNTLATLHQMVSRGQITLVYHPVALLDAQTSNHFSTRAASAAACASDKDAFPAFTSALFAAQPSGSDPGLSDDQLIQIAGSAGIIDPSYAQCVRDQRYRTWVDHVTGHATGHGVNAVPTVTVNGTAIAPAGVAPTIESLITAVGNAGHAAGK